MNCCGCGCGCRGYRYCPQCGRYLGPIWPYWRYGSWQYRPYPYYHGPLTYDPTPPPVTTCAQDLGRYAASKL